MNNELIKALRCLGSQDSNGDCYLEYHNIHNKNDPEISCGGCVPDTMQCPYYQMKYDTCFEDGQCREWLNEVADRLEQLAEADAVVRCKDCQYWSCEDGIGYCTNPDGLDNVAKADDFCSYGTLKGE